MTDLNGNFLSLSYPLSLESCHLCGLILPSNINSLSPIYPYASQGKLASTYLLFWIQSSNGSRAPSVIYFGGSCFFKNLILLLLSESENNSYEIMVPLTQRSGYYVYHPTSQIISQERHIARARIAHINSPSLSLFFPSFI